MEKQKDNLDSWDTFASGNFLKAINVRSEEDAFVCTNVEETSDRDDKEKTIVRLTLERNENDFLFDLNKTNIAKIVDTGIKSPKALIGKKIYFKKALVRNPKTNKEVEGLRIWKIE